MHFSPSWKFIRCIGDKVHLKTMPVVRTFDLLAQYHEKFPQKEDALAGKENGNWIKYSSQDYINYSTWISCGLLSLGVRKGDIIATISNNRPEWNFIDMGIAQIGGIHLPIFTTLDKAGYEQIFMHSGANIVFVSGQALVNTIRSIQLTPERLTELYSFDEIEGVSNWKSLVALGKKEEKKYRAEIETIKAGIKPEDWVTLLYTSGTTGNSKGVMLSHQNLISNAKAAAGVFQLKVHHKYLSILPLCHVGERMANYQTQYSGCSIYYAENLSTIASDLQEIRPDGFGAVPRILEKVYHRIVAKGEILTGLKRKLFFWALHLGFNYETGNENGFFYSLQLKAANVLVFSKWRQALGGNVKFIGIGGATLSPKLEKVFWAAGIKLLNMYGLTETSPIITINRASPPLLRLGTAGALIEHVHLRIADDGEILCKGPNVMLGYFKDQSATSSSIDPGGWFHTGDVGELIDGKFLKITDRKKEIFKLSNGKYVTPQAIENRLNESTFIDQSMVIGESEKFASALISPNFESLKKWCAERKIESKSTTEMIHHPEVIRHYKECVEEVNNSLDSDQKLKRTRLVSESWTPESNFLSATLKLKRRVILEKYQSLIQDIFGHEKNLV